MAKESQVRQWVKLHNDNDPIRQQGAGDAGRASLEMQSSEPSCRKQQRQS